MKEDCSTEPHVSIIVHNYKGFKRLETCLSSLSKTEYCNMDIIVTDALSDGIDQWIKDNFQNVTIAHFDQDDGIPARRNAGLGLRKPHSKYVVFMDEDIVVCENWLSTLVQAMESDPSIGAAQPLMLSSHNSNKIDNAGCYIDVFGFPHKIKGIADKVDLEALKSVSYAETAVMIVRCAFFDELPNNYDAFDADYFVHWYDIDFCWKILLSGYKIVFVPQSQVYHERRLSSGSGRLPPKNIYLNTRNKMITLLKNYSSMSLIKFIPCSIGLEVAKAIILLKRKPSHSIAILRALFWILTDLRNIEFKRQAVNKLIRTVPDSMVIRYFLKPDFSRLYRDFRANYSFQQI